ncbi:MAG: Crp/Fnr family transcriptional regulator [Candidatus Eremiobacteraeota bacterium]|nr:Crp/Fnr family transcriptional regulator [Candidatus Eremiobacteraeota bacterium]
MQENVLVTNLPADEQERLQPFLERTAMDFRETLIEQGEPIRYVWFPHDAITSTIVDTPEGTTIEVGLMGMEGMVGLSLLLNVEASNTTVIVQVPGVGARMRADHFIEHVVKPGGALYERLLRYTNAFMAMVAQTAACNSLHSVDERLSRWLLMTHDRVQRDQFPLTHEFLAYMLGVRRPSVSVAANTLLQNGSIRYSRGLMTILNRQGLEDAVCPCYEIVKKIMTRVRPDFQKVNAEEDGGAPVQLPHRQQPPKTLE